MSNMAEYLLKEHRGKTLGCLVGIALALAILIFSVQQVLFILFCGAVGYLVGKMIDDQIDVEAWFHKVFGPRD